MSDMSEKIRSLYNQYNKTTKVITGLLIAYGAFWGYNKIRDDSSKKPVEEKPKQEQVSTIPTLTQEKYDSLMTRIQGVEDENKALEEKNQALEKRNRELQKPLYTDDIYRTNKRAKWHMSSIKANKSILNNLEFRVEDNEYQLDLRDIPLDGILPNGKVDPALWKKSIRYRELVLRLDITDGETKEIIHVHGNGFTTAIDPKYLVIENGKAKDFNDLVGAFYVEFARDDFDFHGYARPDGRKELHIIAASPVPSDLFASSK